MSNKKIAASSYSSLIVSSVLCMSLFGCAGETTEALEALGKKAAAINDASELDSQQSAPLNSAGGSINDLVEELVEEIAPAFVIRDVTKDLSSDLFVELPATGKIPVTLHPGNTVTLGTPTKVSFGVPFPRSALDDIEKIIVTNADDQEVASHVVELVRWNHLDSSKDVDSVRSVLVYLDVTFINYDSLTVNVVYGQDRILELGEQNAVQTEWVDIADTDFHPEEYAASENIREPSVYATLPANWLGANNIRTRTNPVNKINALGTFDTSMPNFAKSAVNDVSDYVTDANRVSYESAYAPWLFDRTSTLFAVYFQTGDVKWLRHAQRAGQFYANHINSNGYFDLKTSNDGKYSYGQALLTYMMLFGDVTMKDKIEKIASAHSTWNPSYTLTTNFWTERQWTYTFLGALSAWETTGESAYADRLEMFITTLYDMRENPADPSWGKPGCFLHTLNSHEGWGGTTPSCSPWMSALMADALWRYYLHSENETALDLLAGLGDYIVNHALYTPTAPGTIVKAPNVQPAYLASDIHLKVSNYDDYAHACDVTGLLAKAAWAKQTLGQDPSAVITGIDQMVTTCNIDINHFHRPNADVNYGKTEWRLGVPRKFSWVFGTTSDLGWFMEQAQIEATALASNK